MNPERIRKIYDRRSRRYNAFVKLATFGLDGRYRRLAVERLHLKEGDRVLDMGCGTGLNLPLVLDRIGSGSVTGVDLSHGMLRRARRQAEQCEAENRVRLVQGAAGEIAFPLRHFDAVIATYLLTTVPEYERAIDGLLHTLKPGGRLVLSDDVLPSGWYAGPGIMLSNLIRRGYVNYRREILRLLSDRLDDVRVTWHHCRLIFIISGTAPWPLSPALE